MSDLSNPKEDPLSKQRTHLATERNYMALERTFLAWVRTGLAGVGGGFVLIRLISFNTPFHQVAAYWAGLLFVLWGIVIFVLALFEYERASRRLKETDPTLSFSPGLSRFTIISLLALSLVVLFLAT